MLTQAFINHFQPIMDNIDKMAKKSLQATFRYVYAVFCNVLPILVDKWTMSSLQPKHEFILHVYSPQKLAENPSMDNYAHPVSIVQDDQNHNAAT